MKLCGHLLIVTVYLQAVSVNAAANVQSLRKMIAARNLAATGLPDPTCATGVISLKSKDSAKAQVCCAGYCGECSDYATCDKVRGQDSKYACCASAVHERRCGGGAEANVCIKSCSDSVPPCIMDEEVIFKQPDPKMRHASSDCNKAVSGWRRAADAAIAAGTVKEEEAKTEKATDAPSTTTTTTTEGYERWQQTDFCFKYCDYAKKTACCVNEAGEHIFTTLKPTNKLASECRNRASKPGIWCSKGGGRVVTGKSHLKPNDVKGWKCDGANCDEMEN